MFLHARGLGFPALTELAKEIAALWWSEELPVAEVMARLGGRWSAAEVEAAAWKLVGSCAAQGRLAIDLGEVLLSRAAPVRLLAPTVPPLLPEPLPDQLPLAAPAGPAAAVGSKGTVEALFTWIDRKFAHRLPGTTKATPAARGAYDSVAAARAAGITLDVLEEFFYRAIVDSYLQEWDRLQGQKRIVLWEEAVAEFGVPQWLGSHDDLTLLLLRAHNLRNRPSGSYRVQAGHGISFQGRRYISPGLTDRLRGQEVDIYYDRRDIAVIYLFVDGVHVGEAYCPALAGRRVSEWEARTLERANRSAARAADAEARSNLTALQEDAQRGWRAQYRQTLQKERERQLDRQRPEMHTEEVAAVLAALADRADQEDGASAPPPRALPLPVADEDRRPVRRPAIHRRESDDR